MKRRMNEPKRWMANRDQNPIRFVCRSNSRRPWPGPPRGVKDWGPPNPRQPGQTPATVNTDGVETRICLKIRPQLTHSTRALVRPAVARALTLLKSDAESSARLLSCPNSRRKPSYLIHHGIAAPPRKDRLRFVIRWFMAVALLPAVSAATLPTPSQAVLPQREMSCCLKMDAPSDGGHCQKQDAPLKSPVRLCCPACTTAWAVFGATPSRLDFSPDEGQLLFLASLERSAHAERPPVPPPRATLG